MDFSPIWILSVIILLLSFLGIIFIAKFLTEPFDEKGFSFMRVFPFEVSKNSNSGSNFYKILVYLFGAMCFSPIFELISSGRPSPFSILLSCIFGFAGICFIFIHIFDVTHVKVHLILFSIFLALVFLANCMVCFNGINIYNTLANRQKIFVILLICSGIAGVFAIISLLIAVNPKLKYWARLDKVEGEEESYARPAKFPLAYSEWSLFLLLFLGELVYFLELTF